MLRICMLPMLALLVTACDHTSSSCDRAVQHVFALTTAGPPGSAPSRDEQAVIDAIRTQTKDVCTREGLSDAQLACILAATSLSDRSFLTCPALVAKKPSWIIAPIGHPEVLDDLQHLRGSAATP